MKASFTSTSISRESMSTTVAMPVRVKPPPAEIGDTISPGCASLETTTPANGARTTRSSRSCARTRSVLRATASWPAAASCCAASDATSARAASSAASLIMPPACSFSLRASVRCASARRTLIWFRLASAASICLSVSACCRLAWLASSRASTWPAFTAMPSSM